jgi:hypothetical protein
MARYDDRWRPSRGRMRYDSQYERAPRQERGHGRRGLEGEWSGELDVGHDPERYGPGRRHESGLDDSPGLYGPARYGLGPYYRRLLDRRRQDGELREEVEEALFYDTWVDAEAITVTVDDGVVTLRGELPSYEEIRYATDDAWDVDGVRGVRSELSIRQG